MRKLTAVLVVVLGLSLCAMADDIPRLEVFGGYSYVRTSESLGSLNVNGWNAEVMGNVSNRLALVADFDGHYQDGTHIHTFTFGPQVSYRTNKLAPFGRFLIGVSQANFGSVENAFAMIVGGGVDATLTDHFGIRIGQADWFYTRFADQHQNNFRFSTGVLFRF